MGFLGSSGSIGKITESDLPSTVKEKLVKVNAIGDLSELQTKNKTSLTAATNEVSAQLANIAVLDIKSYQHLTKTTNGVVDWTNAFQQAFNDLKDNGTLRIPNEVFHCDKATLRNKKNITIKNLGVIKPVPNKTGAFGIFYLFNIENSVFESLNFDGTSSLMTYNGIGVDCPLALEKIKNCTFNNTQIKDTIMSAIISNGGCENVTFNNTIAQDIGEHMFYLSGYGNKNFIFNGMNITNIGVNPNNAANSKMNAVVKGRVTWEKGETELHDKVTLNDVVYTQSNLIYQQVLLWAYDIKEFICNNVKVIGNNVSFALLGNHVEKILINNSEIHSRLFYNINSDKTNLTETKIFNTKFKNFNGFYNFASEYSFCEFDFTGHLYDYNPANIPIPNKVTFNNCNFITDNKRFRVDKLDNKNVEFNFCTFDRYDNTTPVSYELLSIGSSAALESNFIKMNSCDIKANYVISLRFYKRCSLDISNSTFVYGRLQTEPEISLKEVKISNTELSVPKIDSNMKSDRYLLNGLYGKNTFDSTKTERFDEGLKKYTSLAANASVNVDLRYVVARSISVDDLIITNNKMRPFTVTNNGNIFTITDGVQSDDTVFYVRWKN